MEHNLKTWPKFYKAIKDNTKQFDVRLDDRNFQVGDTITFEEYCPIKNEYTGETIKKTITSILGREEDEKEFVVSGRVILGLGHYSLPYTSDDRFFDEEYK